jgi:hypothetical protein
LEPREGDEEAEAEAEVVAEAGVEAAACWVCSDETNDGYDEGERSCSLAAAAALAAAAIRALRTAIADMVREDCGLAARLGTDEKKRK